MAAVAAVKLVSSNAANASVRRHSQRPAATARVAPSVPRARRGVTPQALVIPTYGPTSCRQIRYFRRSPSLGLGLGLARTLGVLDRHLASDWLRDTSSSVHPMEIRTLDDRYELQSDCPGMDGEDITVEVSPDRVLVITGSRRRHRNKNSTGPPTSCQSAIPGHENEHKPVATAPEAPELPAANKTAADGSAEPRPEASEAAAQAAGKAADCSSWDVSYRFRRSFMLPEDADVEEVAAALDRGVLTVTVPRKGVEEAIKTRRVVVVAGGGGVEL